MGRVEMDDSGSTSLQARRGSALPRCSKGRQISVSQHLVQVRWRNPGSLLGTGWVLAAAGLGSGARRCASRGMQNERQTEGQKRGLEIKGLFADITRRGWLFSGEDRGKT